MTSSNRPKDYCKDCWTASAWLNSAKPRPAPYPGPRCYTHHHEEVKRVKAANHERYVGNTYGLKPGVYDRLYKHQTEVCAICKRAKGIKRKLSVDHDHACCAGPVSCGKCIRGLLCSKCNDMLGHARDSAMFFYRAANYLTNPPAEGMT